MHTKIKMSMSQDFHNFEFFQKIYFFELILDGLSNFYQNGLRSSSDYSGKKLTKAF